MVLPVFVLVVLFFALLIAYPWAVLTIGTLAYLACLPVGVWSYREYRRKDAAAASAASSASAAAYAPGHTAGDTEHERPARLN
jgi:CDP-diacylglycerol---serine O-phosphatidyltransferase